MNKEQWKAVYDFCKEYGYESPTEIIQDLRKKQVIGKNDGWVEVGNMLSGFTYDEMINFLTEELL